MKPFHQVMAELRSGVAAESRRRGVRLDFDPLVENNLDRLFRAEAELKLAPVLPDEAATKERSPSSRPSTPRLSAASAPLAAPARSAEPEPTGILRVAAAYERQFPSRR